MALDNTPGGANSNTYCDIAEADAYLLTCRLHTGAWASLTPIQKEAALKWATELLDTFMDWNGSIRDVDQSLRWPRSGVTDKDGLYYNYDTIPEVLVNATASLAFHLTQRDRDTQPELLGTAIGKAKVGPLEVEVDTANVIDLIPPNIAIQLQGANLGQFDGNLSNDRDQLKTVKVRRV